MAATASATSSVPSERPSCTLSSGPATRSSAACRDPATCADRSARGRTPSDIVLTDLIVNWRPSRWAASFLFNTSCLFAGLRRSDTYLLGGEKLMLARRASGANAAGRQGRPIACRLAIGLTGRNRRKSRLARVEADAALGDARHALRRVRDLHHRHQ